MSSHMVPAYQPISFVSPISDTAHRRHSHENQSTMRRLSTYLKNSVTLEDTHTATRRESIISDYMGLQAENLRRSSISSVKEHSDDAALQAWRRQSVDGFWSKHGELDDGGVRRASIVSNREGEVARRRSVGNAGSGAGGGGSGKWRKMSWSGKRDE